MLRQRVLKSSVSESHFGTSATWSPHAHLQFPCCELPAAASMPRTPKYPPEDPNFDWATSQAPRHSVAREFYGGVNIEPSAGHCSADRLLNPLYTSQTASDAVNYAMEAIEKDGGAKPSSQQAAGDGADDQKEDWLQKEGKGVTHMQANFLQVRLGGQLITRFQPFRHSVIIAGRPMQAEWP